MVPTASSSSRPSCRCCCASSSRPTAALLTQWRRKFANAREEGGDLAARFDLALRHTIGTCAYFSMMVFTDQQAFLSFWVGNIYVQIVVLRRTVGSAIPFAFRAMCELGVVTAISWGINMVLRLMGTLAFSILLPFVAGILGFIILLCPQIEGCVRAQVVMILILPKGLYDGEDPGDLYPLRLAAGCVVGSIVGLGVLALPLWRPALAVRTVTGLIQDVQHDTEELLRGILSFCLAAGSDPSDLYLAVSIIERSVVRINKSIDQLEKSAGAAELEQRLGFCRRRKSGVSIKSWSDFMLRQRSNLNTIKNAATQRMEFSTSESGAVTKANVTLSNNIKYALSNLVTATAAAMNVGVVSDKHATEDMNREARELRAAVQSYCEALNSALPAVDNQLISEEDRTYVRLAFILRRIQMSRGLAQFCRGLASFLVDESIQEQEHLEGLPHSDERQCCKHPKCLSLRPWPRFTWDNILVPLKAGIGLAIASLWMSIPSLHDKASPFATFPAITVACVQTGLQGSSYIKCIDRLWATLLACGFGLLIGFFAADFYITYNSVVNVCGATFFTFAAIYLRDNIRPYRQDYAAQSIGFVLFGSSSTGYFLPGYVSLRIVLIIIGTIIFILVEFLIWPRSSRHIVQEQAMIFLQKTANVLHKTIETMRSNNNLSYSSVQNGDSTRSKSNAAESSLGSTDDVDGLRECSTDIRRTVVSLKTEIAGAIVEPVHGFSPPLKKSSWHSLVRGFAECEAQTSLLLDEVQTLQSLSATTSSHPLQQLGWSSSVADMIQVAKKQLEHCNQLLCVAFPDGRIRQQSENTLAAIKAASSFHDFFYARQSIVRMWSTQYYAWLDLRQNLLESAEQREKGERENEPISYFIALCMSSSNLLEICRALEYIGRSLEGIVCDFK